jgi:uncharacterized protein (DUF58 family)
MSVTKRAAILSALASTLVLVFPLGLMLAVIALIVALSIVDAWFVRTPPTGTRSIGVAARGLPVDLHVHVQCTPDIGRMEIRQPLPPEVTTVGPSTVVTKSAHIDTVFKIIAARRGRHTLGALAIRRTGPLGLGRWQHTLGTPLPVQVFADVHTAHRLALSVRQGLIRTSGQTQRGPLGLGTDFESVRDYRPDDDVRQINWGATARVGRAMSNNLRVEQDRDLMIVVDVGRLTGAPFLPQGDGDVNELVSIASEAATRSSFFDENPLSSTRERTAIPVAWHNATRLDIQLDTISALGLVADEVGDRCGLVAYDDEIQREVKTKRRGGVTIVATTYDLSASQRDSDHERAFQSVASGRRALMMVLTDIVDQAAAIPLLAALPILTRRHDVVVVLPIDPLLHNPAATPAATPVVSKSPMPPTEIDSHAASIDATVVSELDETRKLVMAEIRATGADVMTALPKDMPTEAVKYYVRVRVRPRQMMSAQ